MIDILIIGSNQQIMETIARLIDKEGKWKATIAYTTDEALAICLLKDFKLALLGAGINEEELLKQQLQQLRPTMPIITHYGGGSGLLYAEIHQALV